MALGVGALTLQEPTDPLAHPCPQHFLTCRKSVLEGLHLTANSLLSLGLSKKHCPIGIQCQARL